MTPTRQEALWVLRAQSGDREAMNQLFLAVQDPLYRFLRSLGADSHRAEDLLQEVFVTIYGKLRWLREPALFRTWSYRIAHRTALRRLASERRELERFDESAEMEEVLANAEPASFPDGDLSELLSRVSPGSRAVLALRFEHGLELAEIADVLELPLGTVKSRLGYGLSTLRKRLAEPDAGASPT
jgi:RNA polymerase sigma-70 factor, ECF subfamily